MRLRLAALLAFTLGSILLTPGMANAQATTAPDPTPTAVPTANPIIDGPNITVTLINQKGIKKGEQGKPVPGVKLTVFADSKTGAEVGTQTTDEAGRVSIAIPGKGKYVVVLDKSTLPAGISLSGAGADQKTINALLTGSNFAQFQIGVEEVKGAAFTKRFQTALISGIKFGFIIALAALGLSLIFGTTGLTNFAHGELITFGALSAYTVNQRMGTSVIVAGAVTVVVGGLFGWAQDRALWRPLRNRGTGLIAMMIVSIGFGLLLRSIFQYVFGGSTLTLSQYVSQGRNDYGPISLAPKEIGIIVVAFVVIVIVCIGMMKTRLGKAARAVSDNPALSASSGLRVDGVISAVWILGTALTALAGVLLAVNQQINFLMGFKLLLLVFAAVTLGGLGTIWGALFGAMVIGIMVETAPVFGVPASIKEVAALVTLILILLIRPQGILGKPQRIG